MKPRIIMLFEPWMAPSFTEGSIGGDIKKVSLSQLQAFYGESVAPLLDDDGDTPVYMHIGDCIPYVDLQDVCAFLETLQRQGDGYGCLSFPVLSLRPAEASWSPRPSHATRPLAPHTSKSSCAASASKSGTAALFRPVTDNLGHGLEDLGVVSHELQVRRDQGLLAFLISRGAIGLKIDIYCLTVEKNVADTGHDPFIARYQRIVAGAQILESPHRTLVRDPRCRTPASPGIHQSIAQNDGAGVERFQIHGRNADRLLETSQLPGAVVAHHKL